MQINVRLTYADGSTHEYKYGDGSLDDVRELANSLWDCEVWDHYYGYPQPTADLRKVEILGPVEEAQP